MVSLKYLSIYCAEAVCLFIFLHRKPLRATNRRDPTGYFFLSCRIQPESEVHIWHLKEWLWMHKLYDSWEMSHTIHIFLHNPQTVKRKMLSSHSHAYLLLFNTQAVITHHFRAFKKFFETARACVFKVHFRMRMFVYLIALKVEAATVLYCRFSIRN